MAARDERAGTRMAAEMAEQPEIVERLFARRDEIIAKLRACLPERPLGAILVARGSSDNAAVFGRYLLAPAIRRPVSLAAPSLHTLYGKTLDLEGYLVVAASQSGETPEIVSTFESMLAAGGVGVAVTNDPDSPLAQSAHAVLELGAGPELAVPATKTFTAQLAAFVLLAEAAGTNSEATAKPGEVGRLIQQVLDDAEPARHVAEALAEAAGLFVVGRGLLYAVALEAALKLKESALLLAQGYSAADLRHGPIAVVERDFPVLLLGTPGAAAEDIRALLGELRERSVAALRLDADAAADLPIPAADEMLAAFPAAIRAQQLARELALVRGIDPDQPAGLSKITATH